MRGEKKIKIIFNYSSCCCNFGLQFQFLVSPPSHDASSDSVGVFVCPNSWQPYLLPLPKRIN